MRFAHVPYKRRPRTNDRQRSTPTAPPAAWLNLLLWLAAFLVYAATTARDILAADSGEFQLVAAGWGIAHPPGYPLYTVASALWARLVPAGSIPWRVNLLSAALAATTLVLCFEAVKTWARALGASPRRRTVGGLVAALALGSAATFWAQATIANIRMPTVLFTAWGYLALAQYVAAQAPAHTDGPHERRALLNLAIATGLGISHHPSLAFIAAGWAITLLLYRPRLLVSPERWLRPAAIAFVVWLLPQLYLPLRGSIADAPLNPGNLTTWTGFWDHVLARGFGGDMFAFATTQDLILRLPLMPSLFRMQFPVAILIGMAAAGLALLRRHPRAAVAMLLPWAIQSFVTITYRAPQTIEYLMPAYVPMALCLGLGIAMLPARSTARPVRAHATVALTSLAILVLAAQLPGHMRDFGELAADTAIRDYTEPLLTAAPADALILADWRWATPLWALQQIEGRNPAADVVYVNPEPDVGYEEVWLRMAREAGDRPLFATHAYAWEGWTTAPIGGGLRLYSHSPQTLPAELGFTSHSIDLNAVQVVGFRWRGDPYPGSTLELQIAWRRNPDVDPGSDAAPGAPAVSFATRIWGTEGDLLSAADQFLGNATLSDGIRFTRIAHQLPIDRCAPAVTPTIGLYTVVDGAFEDLGSGSLPELRPSCRYPTLPTRRPWPGAVWPRGPLLRGIDHDVHGDGAATAYLHWCGPGSALTIQTQTAQATVGPLKVGQCQTTPLHLTAPANLAPTLQYVDGSRATLLALPLPQPRSDERYLPFGDQIVLVDEQIRPLRAGDDAGAGVLLTLRWLTARPQVHDYAVSTRLQEADGQSLGAHDIQPGLGAIPTLKWVVRNRLIRDPHPIIGLTSQPARYAVVVYDRFRLTPLRPAIGDASYPLP